MPAVAGLLRANIRDWKHDERFLEGILIDYPWADPELTSLVATGGDGEILGFVGAQARMVLFDGAPVRGVCVSHLAVVPGGRAGAAGALLLRRLLTGAQDLTWSDSANEVVVRMWRTFGGHLDHARVLDWMIVLRPGRWLRRVAAKSLKAGAPNRAEAPVGALPFHAAGRRLAPRAFPPLDPEVVGEDASPATIVEHLAEMTRHIRLRVDYGEPHLEHLFGRVEAATGPLTHRLVRRAGQPIGWYAYLRPLGGVCRVLHVAGSPTDADAVFGELVAHARASGATAVTGRMEPFLEEPLRNRMAVLGFARMPVIHTHNPDIRGVLATSSSLLTQLESEWFVT